MSETSERYEFRFPDVGEGIHEGVVVEWLVAEGQSIHEDAPLVKVETDKAVVDIPSPRSGLVAKLHAAAGATINVGDVIVTFDGADAVGGSPAGGAPAGGAPAGEPARDSAPAPRPPEPALAAGPAPQEDWPPGSPDRRPLATPHTRAMARRLGVDLKRLLGSGRAGRITDEDVERASEALTPAKGPHSAPSAAPEGPGSPVSAARVAPAASGDPQDERLPVTHLRRVIAKAMHSSLQRSATVTHVDEADVTELVALQRRLRQRFEAEAGPRLSITPFFVRALVSALRDHPKFNAFHDEARDEIVLRKSYNIGVAVDTPEGLMVPVVKAADRKSLTTLAGEIGDLAARAKTRSLSLDELRGGTCTLTNIGPVGGLFATPILNHPELAIVGTHAIKDRAVFVDGPEGSGSESSSETLARRKIMYLSVSFDHRFIDGAEAARFLADLGRRLSDPELLMAYM